MDRRYEPSERGYRSNGGRGDSRRDNGPRENENGRDTRNGDTAREPWSVLTVQERGDKKFWTKIGVAFHNEGGSIRVRLDAIPLDGHLLICPPKER